jgi:hypothetical protein
MRNLPGPWRAALLAVTLTAASSSPSAQMFVATGRDTLRGLPGVEVIVEELGPELEGIGLAAAGIRGAVERRLAQGGVTIYRTQQQNASPAKAYLYVHLNALEVPGGTTAVAAHVELRQTVKSTVTTSSIVNAMTWDSHNVFALAGRDAAPLTGALIEMVDDFVADWRSTR